MLERFNKRATTREIVGYTAIILLGIIVLVVIAAWLGGDYSSVLISKVKEGLSGLNGVIS